MKIKAILRLGLMGIGLAVALCSCMGVNEKDNLKAPVSFMTTDMVGKSTDTATTVYVCKSTGAKKYHYKNTCRGLSACMHDIVKMDKNKAENRGFGLCRWED